MKTELEQQDIEVAESSCNLRLRGKQRIKNKENKIILEYEPAKDEQDRLLQIYEFLFRNLMIEDIENMKLSSRNAGNHFKELMKTITYINPKISNNIKWLSIDDIIIDIN